jgi:hypothetical protein
MRDGVKPGEYARRDQPSFGVHHACGERACRTPPAGGGRQLHKSRTYQLHSHARETIVVAARARHSASQAPGVYMRGMLRVQVRSGHAASDGSVGEDEQRDNVPFAELEDAEDDAHLHRERGLEDGE